MTAAEPVIYDGFGAGIRTLNQTMASRDMRSLPHGRAYAKPSAMNHNNNKTGPAIYTGGIHAIGYAETRHDNISLSLGNHDDFSGSIYMGTAGFLNLSFITAAKPGAAILFDINPVQTWFWNHILPMLAEEKDSVKFMDALVSDSETINRSASEIHRAVNAIPYLSKNLQPGLTPQEYMEMTYIGSPFEQWELHMDQGCMQWVRDPQGYAHLRDMVRRDAIGALTLDALDDAGWAQLAEHLSTNPAGAPSYVKTVYISNILTFLEDGVGFNGLPAPVGSPVHMRRVISQVMNPHDSRVIGSSPDPDMAWPLITMEPTL